MPSRPTEESVGDALSRKVAAMSTVPGPSKENGEKPEPREHPDKSIANIYAQNQAWKNKKLEEDKNFFKKLGAGHAPDFMWIGKCSFYWLVDARLFKHTVPLSSQPFFFKRHFRLLRRPCSRKRDHGRGVRIRLCGS